MKIKIFYPEVYEIARFKKKRKEYPPFGVMYLAALLEKEGFDIEIEKITSEKDIFELSNVDIIMFSLSSSVTYQMMLSCKKNNTLQKTAKVIIGGIHASIFPIQSLDDFDADYVVIGEGEIAILKILSNILRKTDKPIKGVITKNKNFKLEYADFVEDLDSLPFPARHLLAAEDVILTGRLSRSNLKMAHILASRGCPFHCYFCGGINKSHRYRSGQNILEELQYLVKEYKIQGFVINDENFIINKTKVIDICNTI